MDQVFRATYIKHGERSEFARSFVWRDGTSLAQFAVEAGFPGQVAEIHLSAAEYAAVDAARIFEAVAGDYPRFLLTVVVFGEMFCIVGWDIVDLMEAIRLFHLPLAVVGGGPADNISDDSNAVS